MDPLNLGGFQPVSMQVSMFVDPNDQEEKGGGSIHSRLSPVIPDPVVPIWQPLQPSQDKNSAVALEQVTRLLQNPNSRRLMGGEGIPHRMIPGVLKSRLDQEEDYPDLILESSLIKIQKRLQEDLEHHRHQPLEGLDCLYYIPVINWLFLRLQQDQPLTDHPACSLCQDYRIQKFMDGSVVQIILAIALIFFNFLKVSAMIAIWNTVCIFWEGARSSTILDLRTLSAKETGFLERMGVPSITD